MSPEATPTTALAKLMQSNAADSLSRLLPMAGSELDRELSAKSFEPSIAARRLARRTNAPHHARAERLLKKSASVTAAEAAFDLRMMESDASFALGVAYGLKLGGGAK